MAQIGMRWDAGTKPPASVPVEMLESIEKAELEHTSAKSWTLTWLEGKAVCELEGAITIYQGATSDLIDEEDDSWLTD